MSYNWFPRRLHAYMATTNCSTPHVWRFFTSSSREILMPNPLLFFCSMAACAGMRSASGCASTDHMSTHSASPAFLSRRTREVCVDSQPLSELAMKAHCGVSNIGQTEGTPQCLPCCLSTSQVSNLAPELTSGTAFRSFRSIHPIQKALLSAKSEF